MRHRAALALILSTMAGVALVEGALRAAGYHGISPASNIAYDRELGWTLVPNRHEWESGVDYGVWATTDADGLRVDDDRPSTSPSSDPVILVLGDSYAYGYGVAGDKMFATSLERELARTATPYRVRTAGVPGYSTDQEYLRWRRLARVVRPRRVILLFHQSDVADNGRTSVVMGPERFFKPRFAIDRDRLELTGVPVPDKSRLVPAGPAEPVKAWFRPLSTYAVIQAASRRITASAARPPVDSDPADEPAEAYAVTAALLRALDRDVRAAGADFMVVLVPATSPQVATRLADICRTEGIPFIDLAPAFAGARDVLLPFDHHWNARGHAIAARGVAGFLRERSALLLTR